MHTTTDLNQPARHKGSKRAILLGNYPHYVPDSGMALGSILAVTSPRVRERIALYNRVFGIMASDGMTEEVHIARATDELSAILRLVYEEQGLLFAPAVFSQSALECGITCEGHPQNGRLQACLEQIDGLAVAIQHLLHLHYSAQVVHEYTRFQEYYRQCFAMLGREEANRLSVRYEASPCPAPQLVFDGKMANVVFAGKLSCQRLSELQSLWQPAFARPRGRTVDRYFPTMFARHMP